MLRKLVRDEWVKVVAFTVLMSAGSVIQVLFWPNLEKMMPAMVEAMPEFLRGIFGSIATEGFFFWIITQQFIKNIGVFGSALAILLGASALAREMENGTMELLLAQPISRARVLAEKFVFNAAVLALPVLVSTMIVYPTAMVIGERIDPLSLLIASLYCYSVLVVVFAFTFALGAVIDEQMKALSISLSVCILMLLFMIFDESKFLSIFTYIDPDHLRPIFVAGRVPWGAALIFVAISAGFLGLTYLVFRKKPV